MYIRYGFYSWHITRIVYGLNHVLKYNNNNRYRINKKKKNRNHSECQHTAVTQWPVITFYLSDIIVSTFEPDVHSGLTVLPTSVLFTPPILWA